MSKVAVIIINYNTYQKTKECIDILRENTTVEYHIYLLDNGSKNESLPELKKYYEDADDVTLIASEENLGYARGKNKLLQRAMQDESQFAVIMNNDIFLMNNAIDLMIEDLQNDKDISFVGPHMVGTKGEIQLTAKHKCPDRWQYLCRETLIGRFFKKNQAEWLKWQEQQETKQDVYWLSGAIFAARMKDFEKIDFFDSFTFLYYEEYIIAEKSQNAQLRLQYEPDAKVLHQHGGSTKPGVNLLTRTENFKSELYFMRKYKHWKKSYQVLVFVIRILETYIFWRKDPSCWKAWKSYVKFGVQELRKEP